MKRIKYGLAIILFSACTSESDLTRENEELLQLTKELSQVAEEQKQRAEAAVAMAAMAQSEAEKLQAESVRQTILASEAMNEAEIQAKRRLEEVSKLKEQLANCK